MRRRPPPIRIETPILASLLAVAVLGSPVAFAVESHEDGLLTRGPYLQLGTDSSIVIRWRTGTAVGSRLLLGDAPGRLEVVAIDRSPSTDHEVVVEGLEPATTYYYAVGTETTLLAGDDADHHFRTAPSSGTSAATRIWILGDSGTGDAGAESVRDAYERFAGSRHTNLWLMLGDNAYPSGSDDDYQRGVFEMYPRMLRTSVLWPSPGNHDLEDYPDTSAPYFDIFTLPANAEAGGLASGTEAYYSFDHANIHFVVLDSHASSRSPGGPMLTWLAADLADTEQEWIIAYWHHPPYSKGSHDSEDPRDSGGRMRDMRTAALPILEAHGVDLVLSGHSHSYERSFLLNGHYGTEAELGDPERSPYVLDPGDGRKEGDGPYMTAAYDGGSRPSDGTVYVVAGSSGEASEADLDHRAMLVTHDSLGSLVLDVEGRRLDLRFLDTHRTVVDELTIVKRPAVPTMGASGR